MLDRLFLYHPAPWEERDWARLSGLPLEEVRFRAKDGPELFGWYLRAPRSSAVLLWCHGNAGNVTHRLENLRALYQTGLSVLLFDYRGYGRSEGRPSEQGLYRDALAAYDHLVTHQHIDSERLVLFGRSLGGAVAGELAVRRRAAGLILESTFPSVEAVARFHYWGLPAHWLIGAEFRLVDRLPHLMLPSLVIHGDQDDLIPPALGKAVFDALKGPKTFYLVKGADHNNLPFQGGLAYFTRLRSFIESVVRG